MIKFKQLAIIMLALLVSPSCQNTSSGESSTLPIQATPTLISPTAGYGGIFGTIQGDAPLWKGKSLFVYAAPFSGDSAGQGIYILESILHAKAEVQFNGQFQINNLTPGSYVLVIGPNSNDARAALDEGKPYVFQVTSDELINAGTIIIQP
ncbi:MAG: hypothetical protein HZB51_23290 [Chloroflexi bacterium]|nr:hypothetical protein [Chloroflexota bacterium]